MSLAPLALMLALAAHNPGPRPQPIELTGEVKEVSGGAGTSRALLITEDGSEYQLHGAADPSERELVRLSGAKVHVFGMINDPRIPLGKHVMVGRYEITDVGGVVPRIGHLAKLEIDRSTRLLFVDEAGNAELLPEGWAKKMMSHVGAKIWMVGSRAGKHFQPQRFAILKDLEEGEKQ